MNEKISPYQRSSIANAAVQLLGACNWDVDAAHAAVEAMRPISKLHHEPAPSAPDTTSPPEPTAS